MARAMLRSSLSVMMVAVIFMAVYSPPSAIGREDEAEKEDDQGDQPSLRRPALRSVAS